MAKYIDVVLPIPLEKTFTYSIDEGDHLALQRGLRVAVPFGKSKIYTGIVYTVHDIPPTAYKAKPVYEILDQAPLVTEAQLNHWEWMAGYYLCTLGEIVRAALPGAFLLESETLILKNPENDLEEHKLSNPEFIIVEALGNRPSLRVAEVSELLGRSSVLPLLNQMMEKGIIVLKEQLHQQYQPKKVRYLQLNQEYLDDERLISLLDTMTRAPKQRETLLQYFQISGQNSNPILFSEFIAKSGASRAVVQALIDKNIFSSYYETQDRVQHGAMNEPLALALNAEQEDALKAITKSWLTQPVALLFGVTSSGKTELYINLMRKVIEKGQQVLFLVPEIALTTQLIRRLQSHFGDQIAVYHSKYSLNERVEIWNQIRADSPNARIILGARSALFMPFNKLGLIVVDEEHDNSYKQFDPAPRYHARDAAIVLARQMGAKVILGSATPSVESYYNVQMGKYGMARLEGRFGQVLLPTFELVDLGEVRRKKKMKGHFSPQLLEAVQATLSSGAQVILFQNRRGFAPVLTCLSCGHVPHCTNCDVSLTYHRHNQLLRCHYCGYHEPLPTTCAACGNATLDTKGLGTEQVATELEALFPAANISRMDYDTTRGKNAYYHIIEAFEKGEIDILVGTQMVTKGLDFRRVDLVGVMNADTLLNFPDFKAHERCYQLLTQVAGRAGRTQKQGRVILQTYSPDHPILHYVKEGNYEAMFKAQIEEREQFQYPPVIRIIRITLKHRNYQKVDEASIWFAGALQQVLEKGVLGPESPAIGRVRNQYIKQILIKFPRTLSPATIKNSIKRIHHSFNAISNFSTVRVIYDVDYL